MRRLRNADSFSVQATRLGANLHAFVASGASPCSEALSEPEDEGRWPGRFGNGKEHLATGSFPWRWHSVDVDSNGSGESTSAAYVWTRTQEAGASAKVVAQSVIAS